MQTLSGLIRRLMVAMVLVEQPSTQFRKSHKPIFPSHLLSDNVVELSHGSLVNQDCAVYVYMPCLWLVRSMMHHSHINRT